MKLDEIKLTNFRGYAVETLIPIDHLTVLVGRNDAGKSTILEALDVFFNDEVIEREDCCVHTGSTEIRIACVFSDLPKSLIIDEQYATTLNAEYLLRSDGKLEIIKVYDCNAAKGKFSGAYAKALHPSATDIDDLLSLKLTELQTKAKKLGIDLSNVKESAKAPLRKAIWDASQNLQLTEREISLKKESSKDAFDQILKCMPLYALFKSDRASTDQDAEAQDPLKAAIKEAIRRRESALNGVIADIQTELAAVAARTVEKIREMSPELANELNPSVKSKQWDSLFSVTLTGEDQIPINKRGSGTRRLVLLNFFRAKAEDSASSRASGVIYAIEEPETSQHPNHQLMLLDAFEQLVAQGACQVILTTHTPTLARRVNQNNLRLITKQDGVPVVELGSSDATLPKIIHTLGVLPDHDVKVFLGVEGKHDISFLKTLSSILSATENDIPNLEVSEATGKLVFVPLGGSSLELWVNRLKGLNRPEFYLTDRDNLPPKQAKYHQYVTEWSARGCTAWITGKLELENYLHPSAIQAEVPTYSGTGIDFEDVPSLFAEAVHDAGGSPTTWATLTQDKQKDKSSSGKKRLNSACVANMTPELLTKIDSADEVRGWLRSLGKALNA